MVCGVCGVCVWCVCVWSGCVMCVCVEWVGGHTCEGGYRKATSDPKL